jgi:regulator of replication initiation timing
MQGQVTNLKQAIGTLADVVSEEIEHIRRVVISGDVENKIMQTHLKIEGLQSQLARIDNESSRYQYSIEALREEIGVMQGMEGKKIEVTAKGFEEKVN